MSCPLLAHTSNCFYMDHLGGSSGSGGRSGSRSGVTTAGCSCQAAFAVLPHSSVGVCILANTAEPADGGGFCQQVGGWGGLYNIVRVAACLAGFTRICLVNDQQRRVCQIYMWRGHPFLLSTRLSTLPPPFIPHVPDKQAISSFLERFRPLQQAAATVRPWLLNVQPARQDAVLQLFCFPPAGKNAQQVPCNSRVGGVHSYMLQVSCNSHLAHMFD